MTHVVIGAGEVGTAIAAVLSDEHDVLLRDIESVPTPLYVDAIHICFPHFEGFEEAVRAYQREYLPPLTVIHSTVPVGTSASLDAIHSPVRGRHPQLEEGVRTFEKFFGGPQAALAATQFAQCGVQTRIVPLAATTEAGKHFELAQYGMQIAIEKEIHALCEKHGLDFEVVYTQFAETYNAGYLALGEPQFVRPIIRHIPGPIGGHCVVQNARLFENPFAEWIERAGQGERTAFEVLA